MGLIINARLNLGRSVLSVQSGQWSGKRSGLRSGQWSGLGSVLSGYWSGQRSGRCSGQRSGLGSVRFAQWSGQCLVSLVNGVQSLFSLANGVQRLFSLANGGQSLFGLANTYLWVWSVWPMPVLGMVGLANACLGSRTSSWEKTNLPVARTEVSPLFFWEKFRPGRKNPATISYV